MPAAAQPHARPHTDVPASDVEARIARAVVACRELASTHYENFMVLSRLLPEAYRDDFAAVYAFCRRADDAADEIEDPAASLRALADLRADVDSAFTANPDDPHFPALARTVAQHRIPLRLFNNLLSAFEQDRRILEYNDWPQLLDYCTRSADPVGRLVLHVTGHSDRPDFDHLCALSDRTCTALQLTNFWQDVHSDWTRRRRLYLPKDRLAAAGLDRASLIAQIEARRADERFRALMRCLIADTRDLFAQGRRLLPLLNDDIRPHIEMFSAGGEHILTAIERQDCDVLRRRPTLSSATRLTLLARTWWKSRAPRSRRPTP